VTLFDGSNDNSPHVLRRRIEALERQVDDLRRQVAALRGELGRVGFTGTATDSFHDREDARLRGMLFALVELLVERGGLDQEEAVARLDAALNTVEPEPAPAPGPFDAGASATPNALGGAPNQSARAPAPAADAPTRCGACGQLVTARETYYTGSGVICEACRAAQLTD
jgi:polyhydroxyalkanoate synthesis regulator phasin